MMALADGGEARKRLGAVAKELDGGIRGKVLQQGKSLAMVTTNATDKTSLDILLHSTEQFEHPRVEADAEIFRCNT